MHGNADAAAVAVGTYDAAPAGTGPNVITRGIRLDPMTELLMLLTVTSLMLSTGNTGIMIIVKPVLSLLPFALLLSGRQIKTSAKYLALYTICFAMERVALNFTSGILSFILLALTSIMTRFAPGIMMGAFLISTTPVSDFIAAMERMHVTEKIIIPMSVIFRFIPTIAEEYRAISDAMRMRGIRISGAEVLAAYDRVSSGAADDISG
ncbi:MAG: energy-coupling factor transporter transmembrane component T [Anaerovoracaceae bacterium]